ncbi:MAG: glycosyltransferase family 2 protein [Prevotella sp.]|nr:glycosyltransferase family 2 protein [Prevotella sp.]MCM1074340.1 glycosyltransferase family 2 protein [Ruminococcus sp.]
MRLNSHQPAISVIVPIYKVEKYLRECVDSVLAQTFRDFEIILVDDGSPDSCPQICDDYAAKAQATDEWPLIKVVHKANAGLGLARNSGMEVAEGHFVFFVDSDDYLREDTLEMLWKVHEKSCPAAQIIHGMRSRFIQYGKLPGDIVSGAPHIIDTPEGVRRAAACYFSQYPGDEPFTFKGSAWCTLYDLDFLRKHNVRFFSEREYISEDYLFNYQAALHADAIAQVPDTLYRYRVNPNSLTQTRGVEVMQRVADYCTFIAELMLNDGFARQQAEKYAYGYAAMSIRAQFKFMYIRPGNLRDKLAISRQWRELPYFIDMANKFKYKELPRLHRLNFNMFRTRSFRTFYYLIQLQYRLRKMRGYIDN